MFNPTPEMFYHSSELGILIVTAWKVIRAANRIENVLKDFPPHKHLNGFITYPSGFEPTEVEKLKL